MQIRSYRESDLDTIRQITVDAFDGVSIDQNIERRFGPIGIHDWRWRKGQHVDHDAEADGAGIFVAEADDGQIIGCITTRVDREAKVGYIPNLAVRGDQRGRGIGRKLIEFAVEHFRREGMELARIETLDQNPVGKHLYPACGFVEVARQIHYAARLA